MPRYCVQTLPAKGSILKFIKPDRGIDKDKGVPVTTQISLQGDTRDDLIVKNCTILVVRPSRSLLIPNLNA
jgi:hypothetical protein